MTVGDRRRGDADRLTPYRRHASVREGRQHVRGRDDRGYKLCFAGDLAINTLWAWMGAMGTARVDGIVSPAYNVYMPGPRLLPDYVDALVRIPVFAQEVTRYSKGVWSSRLRLYPEGFFETYWPVPPLDEQQQSSAHRSRNQKDRPPCASRPKTPSPC